MSDYDDMTGRDPLKPHEIAIIREHLGVIGDARNTIEERYARRQLGLGEDLERARDTILTRPRPPDLDEKERMPVKRPPLLGKRPAPVPTGINALPKVLAVPAIPNQCKISNFAVNSDKAYRVDLGIQDRTDILIANMSQSIVWVHTQPNINPNAGAYLGVPLKAMSGATSYDGGVLRLHQSEATRFWAIATVAGTRLVVTIEQAFKL